jgi:hypothetical protein
MEPMAALGRLVVAISFVACVACQGGTGSGTDQVDAGTVSGDASIESLQLTCNADSSAFPAFSRSCQDATDCAIANHQTDCCGNTIATGIAQSDLAAFQQSETACQPLFPACGCPALPPVLDDGSMASSLESVGVGCSSEGICVTFNLDVSGSL